MYSFSTTEIQKLTTLLYEELHDDKGGPKIEWEPMLNDVRKYKRLMILELEAIKSALKEYIETTDA